MQQIMKDYEEYPNPLFHEEHFDEQYEKWKESVGEETLREEEISKEEMKRCFQIICKKFPRGTECGNLLWNPILVDETPLEDRGVSMHWLIRVWSWLRSVLKTHGPIIPTRLFVSLFVEPFVLQPQQRQHGGTTTTYPIPLYFFVPLQFRGKPQIFLSHGWDSWLRHLLYHPPSSEPGKLSDQNGRENTFLWLDIFAIVQDPGSTKQRSEVARIGQVVQSIGKTCLIIPGHGSIQFALLPARRSWCCFEIAYTKNLSARAGLNKAYFDPILTDPSENISYHENLVEEICRLKCADAETHNQAEKNAIQDLLDKEVGLDKADYIVRNAILKAFYERHLEVGLYRMARIYRQALDGIGEGSKVKDFI